MITKEQHVNENSSVRRTEVTADDMKLFTSQDFAEIQRIARGYCRAVDSTRSRRRMNGSATAVRNGVALYGTDDVSDDVTQDAVLMFAKRLREVSGSSEVSAVTVATREPSAWQYVRRDGETIIVTRKTLQYWAVRDAAARNGYRLDVKPDDVDATPGAQLMRGVPHADKLPTLAVTPYLSGNSEVIFKSAWADGADYPTLRVILDVAEGAEDLGRTSVIGSTAQTLHGGPRNSSSKMQRTKDAAKREWQALSASLDAVRDDLVYRGATTPADGV